MIQLDSIISSECKGNVERKLWDIYLKNINRKIKFSI